MRVRLHPSRHRRRGGLRSCRALAHTFLAVLFVVGLPIGAGLASTIGSTAGASTVGTGSPTPILSLYESATTSVSRDDGLSVALPNGSDLWIFGDTGIYQGSDGAMSLTSFIKGSTAAEGPSTPGEFPTGLMEVPSPNQPLSLAATNPPELFLPAPTGVDLPDGSGAPCSGAAGYSARWVSGAALLPGTDEVLITYADMCVTGSWDFSPEGWGFEEYNWQTNQIDVGPKDVFAPSASGTPLNSELSGMGSPVIADGQVSLFSSNCVDLYAICASGAVYETTMPDNLQALEDPASYSLTQAVTDGSFSFQPLSISVAAYSDVPYRMIEETSVGGTYQVLTADSPSGPWHFETSGIAPGCSSLSSGFCYAFQSHPELGTPSQLALTYFDPGAGPQGTSGPVGHLVGEMISFLPGPTVTQVSPNQGSAAGGSTITISGSNFSTSPGQTAFDFGSYAASGVSCSSAFSCTAVAPPGSGSVDVTALVNGASSPLVATDRFTYVSTPPTITSGSSASFVAGSSSDFTVTTSGSPAPSLSESGLLPSGVTFEDNGNGTATLGGEPTDAGSYPITITASNGASPDATQAFTLNVAPAPRLPKYELKPDQKLKAGWTMRVSTYTLIMQGDGNLVLYESQGSSQVPLWSSGTWGHPGAWAIMQGDGNLVVYVHSGHEQVPLWSTGTWGHPGTFAILQGDRNFVLYWPTIFGYVPLWASWTQLP